jgi:hypothetical protein
MRHLAQAWRAAARRCSDQIRKETVVGVMVAVALFVVGMVGFAAWRYSGAIAQAAPTAIGDAPTPGRMPAEPNRSAEPSAPTDPATPADPGTPAAPHGSESTPAPVNPGDPGIDWDNAPVAAWRAALDSSGTTEGPFGPMWGGPRPKEAIGGRPETITVVFSELGDFVVNASDGEFLVRFGEDTWRLYDGDNKLVGGQFHGHELSWTGMK